jgi:hypothetical protein
MKYRSSALPVRLMMEPDMPRSGGKLLLGLLFAAAFAGSALADKITGRIISFEVAIDETVQFGSLQLTPRVCYSRPAYENPQTDTFVEVDEIGLNNEFKRLFSGWMFAASPGLSAVEHPVYDLWLTECKGGTEIIKVEPEKEEVMPVPQAENKRPAKPVQAPARVQNANNPARQQPSQSFFPTNQPAAPAAPSGGNRPMNIMPGPDPARGN